MSARAAMLIGVDASSKPAFPVWLPTAPSGARPAVYADFVNGNYWGNGAIQAGPSALFFQDTDWNNYDPSSIVPGSGMDLQGNLGNPCVQHTMLGSLLSAATCVINFHIKTLVNPTFTISGSLVQLPAFDSAGGMSVSYASPPPGVGAVLFPPAGPHTDLSIVPGLVADNAFAFTVYSDHTTGSANGAAFSASSVQAGSLPPTDIGIGSGAPSPQAYITAFAVYAPQPDADLPTLSTP